MATICHVCSSKFDCPCQNESHIKLKYRTCALTDGYPTSLLSGNCELVHLCSRVCGRTFLENEHSEMGLHTVHYGPYSMTYDPLKQTRQQALAELMEDV